MAENFEEKKKEFINKCICEYYPIKWADCFEKQCIANDPLNSETCARIKSVNDFEKEIRQRERIAREHTRDNGKVYQQGVKDTQDRIEKGILKQYNYLGTLPNCDTKNPAMQVRITLRGILKIVNPIGKEDK